MRIVKADWEQRNLGVLTYELDVCSSDCVLDIKDAFSECSDYEYCVVKVSSDNFLVTEYLRDLGFEFIETAVNLSIKPKDFVQDIRLKSITEKCTYLPMTDTDLDYLYEQINSSIFHTDRIYLDSFFDPSVAAKRYINWIKDLVAAGSCVYKVLYNSKVIGFFVHKIKENKVFDGILAGTYSGYEGTGLGYLIQWAGIKNVLDQGGRIYLGHVSLNNPSVFKILLSLGFKIDNIKYVFVKHNRER